MKTLVPPAPVASFAEKSDEKSSSAPKNKARKLDLALLPHLYAAILVGGLILTLAMIPVLGRGVPLASFGGGFLLAALLLKGQEFIFRQLVALLGGKKSPLGLLFVVFAPLKLAVVLVLLFVLKQHGLVAPVSLGLGFFLGQLLIVARLLSLNVRSVREVYIEGEKSR